MIEFNENFKTYTCPHCGCKQSFIQRCDKLSAQKAISAALNNGMILGQEACIDLYIY